MRKAFVIVALLAMAIIAVPASAVDTIQSNASNLVGGSYAAKYENYSDLYVPAGATWTSPSFGLVTGASTKGTPVPFGASILDLGAGVGTLENRAIFKTTSIQNTSNGDTDWNGSSQQLTGLFYDLTLTGLTVSVNPITFAVTDVTLDFSPSSRTSPLTGPGLATAPPNSGGVLEAYVDSSQVFNPSPNYAGPNLNPSGQTAGFVNSHAPVSNGKWGPGSWVQGSGTSDTYAGASAGSLWLSGEFVPLEDAGFTPTDGDPTAVLEENIDPATGVGGAVGYLHLTGGTDFSSIGKGDLGFGPDVDMTIGAFEYAPKLTPSSGGPSATLGHDSNYFGTGYWPVDSQDPVNFDVAAIPEPATLSLLGFGLAGLLIRRRK